MAAAVFFLAYAALAFAVSLTPGPLPGDLAVAQLVQRDLAWPTEPIAAAVGRLGGQPQLYLGLAIVVVAFLLSRRAGILLGLGALDGPVYELTNHIVQRPRPDGHLIRVMSTVAQFSFPSGHAVFFSTYGILLGLVASRRRPRARPYLLTGGAMVGVLAGCSRVWSGAHWPSDVVAGWLLAVGWICLLLSFRRLSGPYLQD